ncbi:MAG: ACT domain-containing protein, partial [Candidatus Krumholzibacteria bacterium]
LASREKKPETVYKSRKRALLRAFPAGRERETALSHVDMLPGRYLLTMNASQVKRHLKLVDTLEKRKFVVGSKRGKRSTEFTFCTMDKPFRLSQLCGVLTLNDCNILFAHAFTRIDGKVLDIFRVEDVTGTMPIDDVRTEKIRNDLDSVLSGKLAIQAALTEHLAKWKRRKNDVIPVPLEVEFDNDTSADVTIIDIFTLDRPGLLFKITRALSEAGLTIHRARISTEANRAIDSFDVQDKRGEKVTGTHGLRSIRRRLEEALL